MIRDHTTCTCNYSSLDSPFREAWRGWVEIELSKPELDLSNIIWAHLRLKRERYEYSKTAALVLWPIGAFSAEAI